MSSLIKDVAGMFERDGMPPSEAERLVRTAVIPNVAVLTGSMV